MTDREWKEMKARYLHQNIVCQTDDGTIDFSYESYEKIEFNGVRVSYDEYLDIQRLSGGVERGYFAMCYYNSGGSADCKGQIEGFNEAKNQVVFKRIFVSGMYSDGSFFDGKEDHVWMSRNGFEQYKVGDSISFSAEVYRYLKTRNGKQLDFGIRSPRYVEKIEPYTLPADDELLMQEIDKLVCETCMYYEHCYLDFCIAAPGYRENRRQELFQMAKAESGIKANG